MAQHDNYDNNILKALQRIANSLEKIEKKIEKKMGNGKDENNEKCCYDCEFVSEEYHGEPCHFCHNFSNFERR